MDWSHGEDDAFFGVGGCSFFGVTRFATRNKCIASSNKCLTSNKKLLVFLESSSL